MRERIQRTRLFQSPSRGADLAPFSPLELGALGCVRMTLIRARAPEPAPPPRRPLSGPRAPRSEAPRVFAPAPPAGPRGRSSAPHFEPARPATGPRDKAVVAVPTRPAADENALPPPRRTAIPARYCEPWAFRLSREEAVYDLDKTADRGSLRALLARAARRLGAADALERWQVLLAGQSPDEQLWGVRPPPGALADPRIRTWAERTLAGAGYDPSPMLREWEIFWRRKGTSA